MQFRRRRRPRRPRVNIKGVRHAEMATGGKVYEIIPESYEGPWELPVGTVLEVVSTPTEEPK